MQAANFDNMAYIDEYITGKQTDLSKDDKRMRTVAWGAFTCLTAAFSVTRILSGMSACVLGSFFSLPTFSLMLGGFFGVLAYDSYVMTRHSDAFAKHTGLFNPPSVKEALEKTYILKGVYDMLAQKV